jgi:hypothetical protein
MIALAPKTRFERLAPSGVRPQCEGPYRLYWRRRFAATWRCEKFNLRDQACDRFFRLIELGVEVHWRSMKRWRNGGSQ